MKTLRLVKFFCGLTVLGFLAACGGGSEPPATISAQPTDQSTVAGTVATFAVVASNATGYQWQRSGDGDTTFTDVSGATSPSLTTAVTAMADSGMRFRVVVTGASGSVTSSAVMLTVTAAVLPPGISIQPAPQTTTAGQDASISVTASGTSVTFRWQRSTDGGTSFTEIAAPGSATLNLAAVQLGDSGQQFRVVVSNGAGSVTSNPAVLTVNPAPSVPALSAQIADQSVIAPAGATFSVVAAGAPAPTLQWQVSTDAGATFADIAGATGSSFTTAATTDGSNGHQYRVIATNNAGAVTSNVATLTVAVHSAPAFTTHPANASAVEGENAPFNVVVTGTPTPALQWQLSLDGGASWSNITGQTGPAFMALKVALGDHARQFRAVASNNRGSVTSNAATLGVLAATPAPVPVAPPPLAPVAPVAITSLSPLAAGSVNSAYSVSLTKTGGTPPFAWTVLAGALPPGATLNASTGKISGTPTAAGLYSVTLGVSDSSTPQLSDQKLLDIRIDAVCDVGLGSATVAGAPSTVEGKFCPLTRVSPGLPNPAGMVDAVWIETAPGISKGVGVTFELATGQVSAITFNLNDPLRLVNWRCSPVAFAPPPCTGVMVDIVTGTVVFTNSVLGQNGTVNDPVTFNGVLKY